MKEKLNGLSADVCIWWWEFIALLRGQPVHIWNACEIFTGVTDTGTHHCQHYGLK